MLIKLKLASFKEEQRPDRSDAASHMGSAVLGHVAPQRSIGRCSLMTGAINVIINH